MAFKIFRRSRPNLVKSLALSSPSPTLDLARALDGQGRTMEALTICRKLLAEQPEHIESLTLSAEIATRTGNSQEAIEFYTRVIELNPDLDVSYYKRGNLLKNENRMAEALANYDHSIALNPGYANAFCNRGVVLEKLDRLNEALDSYDQAIVLNPRDALAYFNRGSVLRALGQREEALASYNRAIVVKPDYSEPYCNRGMVLAELEQWDAALASYNKAIEINPGLCQAYFNRGVLLQTQKNPVAALASFDQAIQVNPDHAGAHCNRGALLTEMRELRAALKSLDQAIRLSPDFAEAYCNRGLVHAELNESGSALRDYDKAISIKPDYPEAYYNRATSLVVIKQFAAAIADIECALALKPDFRYMLGVLRHTKMQVCDWDGLDLDVTRLVAGIEAGAMVSPPFQLLALMDAPPLHLSAAQSWVREECPMSSVLPTLLMHPPGDKIRIGYFSADFRDHAVTVLMAGLFETHDRSKFEVTAFAFGPDTQDDMRKRLERAFDRFIDVREKSDQDVAMLARNLKIDIAIDLGGFTGHSRTKIFAFRAAPLQVGYVGYLGTMGAPYMDYLIADHTIIPAAEREHYSEKIIYLPNYQVNDDKRLIAQRSFTREELGIPAENFVFCCFNSNYKIMPAIFAAWMRILRRVPRSVFFIYAENALAAENMIGEARRHGIETERMIFGARLGTPDYLARLRTMSLFLDTLPYNAGATASDALWAGLPVLTCTGRAFAGRVAASLLNAIQLPELITSTLEEYENLAVRLATNPHQMALLKRKLEENRHTAPLFNTELFTRNLEAAYSAIYSRCQQGVQPAHILSVPA